VQDILLNPVLWIAVLVLTLLGVAFSYVKYEFGKRGWGAISDRYPYFEEERIVRISNWYRNHGSIVLLGSAIPGMDTLVAVSAGALGISGTVFLLWVTVAKLARFTFLALTFAGLADLLRS
jgi:membrane protein YqaA with SNARE-associated domain